MTNNSIGRRQFIGLAAGSAALAAVPWPNLYGAAEDRVPAPRGDGKITISALEPAEVLICGSTLFACHLAVQAAKAGKKTVLVMERVNPFFEGIACLRSWVEAEDLSKVSGLIRSVATDPKTSVVKEGRIYFNALKAAADIEDQLCEAGVRFYYNAPVAGALGHAGKLCGAVFGGKTGLFAVESPVVVDATLDATVARAAGARFVPQSGLRRYHYLADLAAPVDARKTQYHSSGGITVSVDVHHYYAGFELELSSTPTGPLASAEDFEKVYSACLEFPMASGEKRFRGADGYLTSGIDRLESTAGRVAGLDNLWVFGPQGIPGNLHGSLVLKDLKCLFAAFPNAIQLLLDYSRNATDIVAGKPEYEFWNKGVAVDGTADATLTHSFQDHGFEEPGTRLLEVAFAPPQVALKTGLFVVGGGTSGNAAAYAGGELGLNTVCLERGLELGGTNTVGGVTNLWHGNKTPAFDAYYKAMNAKNDGLNAPGFFMGLKKSGVRVLFQSVITGVAHSQRQVSRIYLITPVGLTAIEAPHYIDATGDGSIAAWAGCGYTFGGIHDEMTLWASFAGFRPGNGEALRPFLSPCDERSALDATRFILAMRRNSKATLFQPHFPPPFYLAPRESRHILGGTTLTYLDVLSGRRFRDGVFRVESNPDIKGLATSDAAKAGFIPTNWNALFQGTVPYSAMIPVAMDNVIIAGKAYSVTHDALSVARMQRDMCVMGMVASHAVRMAVDKKVLLRDIPVAELQKVLIAKNMLKPADIADDGFGFGLTPAEMAGKVEAAKNMDSALVCSAMLCVLPKTQALAALEPYAGSSNPAMHRLLCFLGHPKGVAQYLASVEAALNEQVLSKELFGGKGTNHTMPDQGYAAVSALMLGSLTAIRETRAVPLLQKLAQKLDFDSKDLRAAWGYYYMLSVGFERLACSEGIPALKQVLAGALLKDRLTARSQDLRNCRDFISERYTYLRMALCRALTRCGDPEGALELCGFLNEARVCFARAARAELVAALGQDLHFDAGAWKKLIAQKAGTLKANPLTVPFA